MRPSIQQLYPIIALLVVAGATVWLERVTRSEDARPASQQRRAPDFTAEQTRLISFDRNGRQHYELRADKITHHPLSSITELDHPRLRYDSAGRELRISARTGEIVNEGEEVRLAGDVRVRRAAAPGNPEMSFASESLRIWPEVERAETGDPVALTQGASTAHANGLKSDNLFGTLELIGNARVHIPRTTRTSP